MKKQKQFPKFLRIAGRKNDFKIHPYRYRTEGNATEYVTDYPIISTLSEKFKFKFEIIEPPNRDFGEMLPNKSWTGMVGMLDRGEADIAIAKMMYAEERSSIVDFSFPYQYHSLTFITDKPQYLPDSYAIVHPFSPSVWIGVASSLMLVQFLSLFFKIKKYCFQKVFFNIFASLLEKSVWIKFSRFSTKLLLWSWIVGAMFISYSYKAVLLSFLTFPSLTGIRNIPELARATEKSSFKCSVYEGTKLYNEILDRGSESWKKISRCLTQTNMYTNNLKGFLQSSTYGKAYIGTRSHLKSLHKSYFVSDDVFFTISFNAAIRKSFCCRDMVDKFIKDLYSFGILNKFHNDEEFFLAVKEKNVAEDENDINRKLSLEDVLGAFVILGIGDILAIIVLLIEIIVGRKG